MLPRTAVPAAVDLFPVHGLQYFRNGFPECLPVDRFQKIICNAQLQSSPGIVEFTVCGHDNNLHLMVFRAD